MAGALGKARTCSVISARSVKATARSDVAHLPGANPMSHGVLLRGETKSGPFRTYLYTRCDHLRTNLVEPVQPLGPSPVSGNSIRSEHFLNTASRETSTGRDPGENNRDLKKRKNHRVVVRYTQWVLFAWLIDRRPDDGHGEGEPDVQERNNLAHCALSSHRTSVITKTLSELVVLTIPMFLFWPVRQSGSNAFVALQHSPPTESWFIELREEPQRSNHQRRRHKPLS